MPRLLAAASLILIVGCGTGPRARFTAALESGDVAVSLEAYEEFRRTEGGDRELLARVAGLLLREEARSGDPERRRAALLQLTLAGTRGEPVLQEIADRDGVSPDRLDALVALARRGRAPARFALRALADREEPEILAASIYGMDAELDRALLLELLEHGDPRVRANAARALAAAAEDQAIRHALSDRARVDDQGSVRVACVRALGAAGPAAIDALRERLSDPESSVRLAAVSAMMRADEARGQLALAPLLEVDPSPSGIEAARLLAAIEGETGASALRFLERALVLEDAGLRGQAAVALTGLPRERSAPLDAVRQALERERDPMVRLQFARALLRPGAAPYAEVARRALASLLDAEGLARVQAASLLAPENHAGARDVLRAVVSSDAESLWRRTAARALAREALEPDAVRRVLRDDDALVRIYAAGGILAAAAAG